MRVLETAQLNGQAHGAPVDALQVPRVAITGVGLATPLGDSVSETWQSLLGGRFITDHARVRRSWNTRRPRVIELALQTAKEAIASAGWSTTDLASDETALVIGTSKGPIEGWLTPPPSTSDNVGMAGGLHPEGLGEIAGQLADQMHLGCGPRLTVSAACATGLHALIHGTLLIRANQVRRVLVVAAESSLHPLFLGSFQRLGVLARPGIGCRPFDQTREGFLMSEAAAALCLERRPRGAAASEFEDDSKFGTEGHFNRQLSPPAEISVEHFALGGDATHLTGGDPESITLQYLLRQVLGGRPIDLIHAHGTGTELNDARELSAVESILCSPSPRPILYSHKGSLGHSLGAAGLISIVINCLIHRSGIVPGNVQTQHPMATTRVDMPINARAQNVHRSLAIAAGFGGAVAVVSLVSS